MTRLVAFLPLAVVVCVAGFVSAASAQVESVAQAVTQVAAAHGELRGVVTDDRGAPLAGAVVSALGSTSVFAVTDDAGRFTFRTLAPGPYLLRAHLNGYIPARGRIVQVGSAVPVSSSLTLAKRGGPNEPAQVLAAGAGLTDSPVAAGTPAATDDHDHSEAAWWLRHLKRSVLREADHGIATAETDESLWEDSIGTLGTLGRAMGHSARVASSLFTDLPLSGQVNLLTTTSFNHPEELFSTFGGPPRGVAFVSLNAPAGAGDWNIRGAMTEGDLASWVLAGSYLRRSPAGHRYEAGLSYSMQRYAGGNPAALVAVTDGSRRAATVYAYDEWTVARRLTLNYGARYARYDYLAGDGLLSPRVSVTVKPADGLDGLRLRVSAAHREIAPGAEEFLPSASLGVWLPPERTFSLVTPAHGFVPERMNHYEIAAERDLVGDVVVGVRGFRQRVNNQVVTLFGVALPHSAPTDIGHYFVASAGDLEVRGWGVSVSRTLNGRVRGSIDYTRTGAEWLGGSPDLSVLSDVAQSAARHEGETVHDLTTSVHTDIPVTDTRVFVLYKLNSGFVSSEGAADRPRVGARFDVQVNQALPFLNFTCAEWEALFTVRNLFREDPTDGSIYDELLVVKPPKRVVGGLTVRF